MRTMEAIVPISIGLSAGRRAVDFGRYRIPNIGPASEELPASAALLEASAPVSAIHDDWWLDDAPARDLFESVGPNSTAELTGLELAARRQRRPSIYRISPTVRILPMAGRMMPYVSAIRHLPFDGHRLLYGHTHQLSPEAHATKPSTLDWTHGICNPVSETHGLPTGSMHTRPIQRTYHRWICPTPRAGAH